MHIKKQTWATLLGIAIAVGGFAIAWEVWTQGAESYTSHSRRAAAFELILSWAGSIIGDQALAVIFAVLMAGVGFAVHKLGVSFFSQD